MVTDSGFRTIMPGLFEMWADVLMDKVPVRLYGTTNKINIAANKEKRETHILKTNAWKIMS